MPRVTQECDFTIHEDEGSVHSSSAEDDIEVEQDEVNSLSGEPESEVTAGTGTDIQEESTNSLDLPPSEETRDDKTPEQDDHSSSADHLESDNVEIEDEELPTPDESEHPDLDQEVETDDHSVPEDTDHPEPETEEAASNDQPVQDDAEHPEETDKDIEADDHSSQAGTEHHELDIKEPGDHSAHEDTEHSELCDKQSEVDEHPTLEDTENPEPDDETEAQEHSKLEDNHQEAQETQDPESHDSADSRRESAESYVSSNSHRRMSGRTDALIQAAARAVVARIEKRKNSTDTHSEDEADYSLLSNITDADEHKEDIPEISAADHHSEAERSPRASDVDSVPTPLPDDAGGDSSSHNEADDDVFSDRSPRSSMGSLSSGSERKHSLDDDHDTLTQSAYSPRISNISQYDKEDFTPMSRNARLPFRTPSSVRAMQMSSPPSSIYGSPRSSKRGPFPTSSRLGSPTISAQYSPKGRSTPTRLKSQTEAPLVLLHVTLLPLRWPWADVLELAETEELTEATKNLRDSWRQLQSRVGDTVLERGVLLPHPQNDYEILEERVLEAMDLPLRRRARILECGHYLGPSNEMTLDDDSEDEELDETTPSRSAEDMKHWCTTCRNDIKYDSLGPGKVFRVKVYASNGLMKAGAWEACWKEMERVDIEIEPIVDAVLQGELSKLAAEQERRAEEECLAELVEQTAPQEELVQDMGSIQHHPMNEQQVERPADMTIDHRRPPIPTTPMNHGMHMEEHNSHHTPSGSLSRALKPISRGMHMEAPAHSTPSRPQSRALEPPMNSDMRLQERHTSVVNRTHHDTGMEQRSQGITTRRESRMLESPPSSEMPMQEHGHSTSFHQDNPDILSSPPNAAMRIEEHERRQSHDLPSSPIPEIHMETPHVDDDRRRRDEERLREIYGHTPPPARSPSPSPAMHRHEDSYMPGPSPPSPSQQAFERREERRKAYQQASLGELLLEAVKVFIHDRKNVVIAVLGVLALMLALRGSGGSHVGEHNHFPASHQQEAPVVEIPAVEVPRVQVAEPIEQVVVSDVVDEPKPEKEKEQEKEQEQGEDQEYVAVDQEELDVEVPAEASAPASEPAVQVGVPCIEVVAEQPVGPAEQRVLTETMTETEIEYETETEFQTISREIVRVFETVTQTIKVKVTSTATETIEMVLETETQTQTRVVQVSEEPAAPELGEDEPAIEEVVSESVDETADMAVDETEAEETGEKVDEMLVEAVVEDIPAEHVVHEEL